MAGSFGRPGNRTLGSRLWRNADIGFANQVNNSRWDKFWPKQLTVRLLPTQPDFCPDGLLPFCSLCVMATAVGRCFRRRWGVICTFFVRQDGSVCTSLTSAP
ncbi:unnamed protein product [Protopolystoma xenopodis]|uniref:Uncharacterized protein n=1 Tax=Protopolystoma xenopodis TaxID=117903 RepID=A0A448XGC7_9PLAT|nr:unnamed protein product [Protopolystoma xenopodis]